VAPDEIVKSEILTSQSGSILLLQLNRPARKNAMTSSMYTTLADLLNDAAKNEEVRVVLLHGAGDSFSAGNDLEDFLKNPPKPGESPQERFVAALMNFEKLLIAAVHGATVGSGTTMLTHCDFVYAAESTRFQMPCVNLGVVPELGSSYSIPAAIGYIPAAEPGLVTRVVPDDRVLATAMETATAIAEKLGVALQASKRLLKRWSRGETAAAVMVETQEFGVRVRSDEAREAINAFLEKRRPDFVKAKTCTR
jgi:enoyl-CoA hydratase/carnithine racemase